MRDKSYKILNVCLLSFDQFITGIGFDFWKQSQCQPFTFDVKGNCLSKKNIFYLSIFIIQIFKITLYFSVNLANLFVQQ